VSAVKNLSSGQIDFYDDPDLIAIGAFSLPLTNGTRSLSRVAELDAPASGLAIGSASRRRSPQSRPVPDAGSTPVSSLFQEVGKGFCVADNRVACEAQRLERSLSGGLVTATTGIADNHRNEA
jgi:hypothetical protein